MSSVSTALIQPKTRPPTAPVAEKERPPPPSPGNWRHPKLVEIAQRQSASTFSERNIAVIVTNFVLLLSTIVLRSLVHSALSTATSFLYFSDPYTIASYIIHLFRFYLLLNIGLALRPLSPRLQSVDEITDIPLTPSQRALLGLRPESSPSPSPASGSFITPPRYRRSSSSFTTNGSTPPQTDRRSISANYSTSPLSNSRYTLGFTPSPSSTPFLRSTQRNASGSPVGSSLLQKAIARGSRETMDMQTNSFNASTSSFGLSRSQSVNERGSRSGRRDSGSQERGGEPGTPSPTGGGFGGVKRDPGLNYKWLYQRGMQMPKSESMQF